MVSPEGYFQRLKGPDGRGILRSSLQLLWTVCLHDKPELGEILAGRDLPSPTSVVSNHLPFLVLRAIHDNLSFVIW